MPSNHVTTQGEAWDQIALKKLGSEKQMGELMPLNVNEMDILLFPGEVETLIPDIAPKAVKSLPPWEKLK